MTNTTIWALTDDRIGNINQVLGVANAIGIDYERKEIAYNKAGRWPNIFRNKSLIGVDKKNSSEFQEPWPDLVIAAGRKSAPLASYIKKQSGGKTKLVQIMWPGYPHKDFDAIFVPQHDNRSKYENVVETIGAPNLITTEKLQENKAKWAKEFSHLEGPFFSVLIGGTTKKGDFTKEHAVDLANKINFLLAEKQGTLLISNSRRTAPGVTEAVLQNVKKEFYFHPFNSEKENPYIGFLALGEVIIVTGDSVSMCSEACTTGSEVYIFTPDGITPNKHQSLHQNLYEQNYAYNLRAERRRLKDLKTLNDTKTIRDYILTNILSK